MAASWVSICCRGWMASSALLIVDAVRAGWPPGTLVRLEGDAIPTALAHKMSMHQSGLQELLAVSAFQGSLPPHVVLCGLEPAVVDWGLELSPSSRPELTTCSNL